MTHYTLGTAANACGVNKSTVLRAIKAGKVSATRNEHGEWQIDPAEMHRVYPPVAATDAVQQGEQRHALAPLRDRTDELVAQLREQLADMRNERDRARTDAEHLAHGFRAGAHATCPPRPWQRCAIPGNNPCNADRAAVTIAPHLALAADDGVRATMDEIGEHAWIISIVGDFLTLFGAYWTARAVLLAPEQAAEIAVGRWDHNEPLKNALLKQSSDARAGLVCVAVGAGFQIVSKLIEEFFS